MEQYAFPDIGLPPYSAIGPQLGRASISIARTESGFDQRHVAGQGSWADAGHPGSGTRHRQAVRRRLRWNRLVSDPVYNTQMGAPNSPPCFRSIVVLHHGVRRTAPAADRSNNGWRSMVIRAIPRSTADWVERIPSAETRTAACWEPTGVLRPLRCPHRDRRA
jgi:soluble lytic murein transglycosylase